MEHAKFRVAEVCNTNNAKSEYNMENFAFGSVKL